MAPFLVLAAVCAASALSESIHAALAEVRDQSHSDRRQALQALRRPVLREQALRAGADEDLLDEVDEWEKSVLVDLVLRLELASKEQGLRSSLLRLKLRELRERAQRAGADNATIDEADEAEKRKAALVELVLKLELPLMRATVPAVAQHVPSQPPTLPLPPVLQSVQPKQGEIVPVGDGNSTSLIQQFLQGVTLPRLAKFDFLEHQSHLNSANYPLPVRAPPVQWKRRPLASLDKKTGLFRGLYRP